MNLIDILKNYIFEQDSNQNDQIEEIVDQFYDTSDFENVFSNLIKADNVYKGMSMANTQEEKEKIKQERRNLLINLVFEISRFTDNPEEKEAIVEDIVKNKVQNNDLLVGTIKLFYENYKDVKPPSPYPKITRKTRSNKIGTRSDTDKRYYEKNRKKTTKKYSRVPYEVKDKILNFKEGNVHKIIIYPPSDTNNRVWVTIYRKLSKEEKENLDTYGKYDGVSYNYLDDNGNEYPDSDDHKEDIYIIKSQYTNLKKVITPEKKEN